MSGTVGGNTRHTFGEMEWQPSRPHHEDINREGPILWCWNAPGFPPENQTLIWNEETNEWESTP